MGGCIFKDPKVASGVVPMFFMPMILFSGYFSNLGTMQGWIEWFQYISPMRYAFEANIRNQFTNKSYDV